MTPKVTSIAIGLVIPVIALAAACGGGGSKDDGIASAGGGKTSGSEPASSAPGASRGRFYDLELKYTQCIRRHGLPEWPDPKPNGHRDMPKIEELQSRLQSGADLSAGQEKLGKAMRPCMKQMQAADAAAPRRDPRKDYEAMLKHAKCMRKNGLTGFGNPRIVDGHAIPGGESDPTKPKLDPGSPAYKRAQNACRSVLPDGVDQ